MSDIVPVSSIGIPETSIGNLSVSPFVDLAVTNSCGGVSPISDTVNISVPKLKELLANAHRVGFERGENYYGVMERGTNISLAVEQKQCVEEDVTKVYNDFINPSKGDL
jgi:hypothetical protein